MPIGTWNLAGRWDQRHASLTKQTACDVLLLTAINERTELPGLTIHTTQTRMAPRRSWAAIAAPTLEPLPDPHTASASARVDGLVFCSSILPWRSCGTGAPWVGATTAAKTIDALERIEPPTQMCGAKT
jgi:hypothetical protein